MADYLKVLPTQCDICGCSPYALRLFAGTSEGTPLAGFVIAGINRPLYACEACQMKLEAAMLAEDWKMLPAGPLRKAFEAENTRRRLAQNSRRTKGGP